MFIVKTDQSTLFCGDHERHLVGTWLLAVPRLGLGNGRVLLLAPRWWFLILWEEQAQGSSWQPASVCTQPWVGD